MAELPIFAYMNRQHLQEELVKLFLRLNGYFTTGLIIHSAVHGKNQTELDVVAIRLPFHTQPDRLIDSSPYLQIPENSIDIIVGEVKSGTVRIQINSSLRANSDAIEKLLCWIGAFEAAALPQIVTDLQAIMATSDNQSPEQFRSLNRVTASGNYTIRPIIFSIDRQAPTRNQSRYVHGQLMLDYIWSCLRPEAIRETCSTVYDLTAWGSSAHPLIAYFKDPAKNDVGRIDDLYAHFGV